MFLPLDDLQHINNITHEGKVVVFAVTGDGKIHYTVRQDGFEDNFGKTALVGWEDWNDLRLLDLDNDPSVVEKETAELSWGPDAQERSFIIRSVFQGRGQSAVAPVQLISAFGCLYVFRQSPWNSLFVDRFVLDGMSNKLIPKLDVRFKASRQKYKPLEASQANGTLQADSLDFRDTNGNYFYEPTIELPQVGSLEDGWFAVVLLPTAEHDNYRWHFFIYNAQFGQVEIVSIRASDDGLFDVTDALQLLPGAGPQGTDLWTQTPGILRRLITLDNLRVTNAPAAAQYDLQVERNTQAGPQLLREATRVMLAIPTDQGVATLSFAAGLDGTLSMIDESPEETDVLVDRAKDILLPVNTLDEIQAEGASAPLPQGTITGVERGDGDRVTVLSDTTVTLKPGDPVEIGGTAGYDGHYIVSATNNGSFDIPSPFNGSQVGRWQAVPSDQGLIFDGMITAYDVTPDGKLRINCVNHGLQAGDEVQIIGTTNYNGTYPVKAAQDKSFTVDIPWQPGKGLNLKVESRKRRGIALDGQADYIDTAALGLTRLSKLESGGETLSAWVYVNTPASGKEQLIAGRKDGLAELIITPDGFAALRVQFPEGPITIDDAQMVPPQQWVHFAGSFAYDPDTLETTLRLLRNGAVVCEGPAREFIPPSAAQQTLSLDGKDDYVDLLNPQALNIAGRITLEAWVRPQTLDGTQVILAHGSGLPAPAASNGGSTAGANPPGLFLRIKDRGYEVGTTNGSDQVARAVAADGDAGQWFHLAGVYDGTAWQLYKNGQPVNTLAAKSGAVKMSAPWAIGASAGGQAGFFSGQVDEVRVWRTARSADELQKTAQNRLLGNEPGLAGYWAFTALQAQLGTNGTLPDQGVQVADGSRQNNPGTVHGSPSLAAGAMLAAAHLPGSQAAWQPEYWVGGAQGTGADGGPVMQRCLGGKLAEFQVWDVERAPRDIENSMYLQLLGRETGLAGYWRFEAIAEGSTRTTPDFSVFGRDATVHGAAYVGARTLNRTLGDNITPAVKYLNEEFFAVSQRAAYMESFEFKLTPDADPNQAGPDGKSVFAFTYWGKATQGAADLIPIAGQTNHFTPAAEAGWYLAVGSFTVPYGVSLVRTFGIGAINGSWSQLDIRRHHMRMVSGSITETHYTEHLTLDTLGAPQDALEGYLESLAQKELEEPALIAEKQQLDSQIAAASDPALAAQIANLQGAVNKKTAERDMFYNLFETEIRNPLNYVVHMMTNFTGPLRLMTLRSDGGIQMVDEDVSESLGPMTWWFEPRGDGYYRIRKSGMPNKSLDVNPRTLNVFLAPDSDSDSQAWLVSKIDDRYDRLTVKSWGSAKALDIDPGNFFVRLADLGYYSGQEWDIGPWGAPINERINNAQNYYFTADHDLSMMQRQLTALIKARDDGLQLKNQWIQRRAAVVAALNDLQTQIAGLVDSYLKAFTAPGPLSLPELQTDSRSLTTTGGMLGFVRSASRLNLAATSEGNLQLGYFDADGRMRQTIYDATSDSSRNDTFQVWLPDALRTGVNFEVVGGRMQPGQPVPLGEEWTLESWFEYPLANSGTISGNVDTAWQPLSANTLFSGVGGDRHVTVQLGMLGSALGGNFLSSGYAMSQLSHGWHHLAVVGSGIGKASTTRFYIDGKLAGDIKAVQLKDIQSQLDGLQKTLNDLASKGSSDAVKGVQAQIDAARQQQDAVAGQPCKVKSDLVTIGNVNPNAAAPSDGTAAASSVSSAPPPDEPFGKVSEVRVHQAALTAEEVEANSKVTLSGNEPGLAAYYRMDEATGTDARNSARPADAVTGPVTGNMPGSGISTGNPYDAVLEGHAVWWPCAAPIGNPGHSVMGFDGVDDALTATANGLNGGVAVGVSTLLNGTLKKPGDPSTQLPAGKAVYTVEAWFHTNSIRNDPTVFQGILAWGAPGDANGGNWLRLRSDGIETNDLAAQVDNLAGAWHHVAVIYDGVARNLYLDGQRLKTDTPGTLNVQPATQVRIGWTRSRSNSPLVDDPFNGTIAEVRIWDRQLLERELRDGMHTRLTGTQYNLLAYYPLNTSTNPLIQLNGANIRADNMLPLVGDEVVSAEYTTLGTDAAGNQTAMLRRFLACPDANGINLLSGKRIETLERVWIGNTQFKPTLLGYIEGPPPVPSENLTVKDDYSSATQVELVVSDDMAYSWTREQDAGLGATLSLFFGVSAEVDTVEAPLGVGVITTGAATKGGVKADLTTGYSFLNNSTISAANSASSSDRIALTGTQEPQIKFDTLGRRYIPKNVGYALVVSGLADVYILRLKRSGKMVAYQVLPNPNIPMDVNTITFMINPAYTMNGSLDGQTGSQAASDRFFRNVPEMRARYGSLYPASYFRVQEAYALKNQIDEQDKKRQSYFENFNSLLVDEGSVNRQVNAPMQAPSSSEADARQQEIQQKIQDQELATHASASFAAWQRRMEDLQIQAGKHNIVNTYVWDSDGGLRAESQSFASTVEHTVGGSFSLDGAYGADVAFDVFGFDFELTAQATVHVTQTLTKTQNASRGLALNVDLSGLESTGITDYNDHPIVPGEKVSRYRLMSFYLEGSTDHYNTFFSEVVDPEWLQSNSEEARALRQVRGGKANKTWRVLHRVTYVERPALMGFGQDVRALLQSQAAGASLDSLQASVSQLQAAGQKLQDQFDSLAGDLTALGAEGMALKQQLDDMQKTLADIQQSVGSKAGVGKPNK